MTKLLLSRRKLISNIGLLIAAPAIVRASSLMPVKAWQKTFPYIRFDVGSIDASIATMFNIDENGVGKVLYSSLLNAESTGTATWYGEA